MQLGSFPDATDTFRHRGPLALVASRFSLFAPDIAVNCDPGEFVRDVNRGADGRKWAACFWRGADAEEARVFLAVSADVRRSIRCRSFLVRLVQTVSSPVDTVASSSAATVGSWFVIRSMFAPGVSKDGS